MTHAPDNPAGLNLMARLARAMEAYHAMSPEQQDEMWQRQRESWVRGMAPCEHGDPDWETCGECAAARAIAQEIEHGD